MRANYLPKIVYKLKAKSYKELKSTELFGTINFFLNQNFIYGINYDPGNVLKLKTNENPEENDILILLGK